MMKTWLGSVNRENANGIVFIKDVYSLYLFTGLMWLEVEKKIYKKDKGLIWKSSLLIHGENKLMRMSKCEEVWFLA